MEETVPGHVLLSLQNPELNKHIYPIDMLIPVQHALTALKAKPFPPTRFKTNPGLVLVTVIFLVASHGACSEKTDSLKNGFEVTIEHDGRNNLFAPMRIDMPENFSSGIYPLLGMDNDTLWLQIDHSGAGWLIPAQLDTHRVAYFLDPDSRFSLSGNNLELNDSHGDSGYPQSATVDITDTTLVFRSRERHVMHFYHQTNNPPESLGDRYQRAGYIHPLLTPKEVSVTQHLNPDYPHHSGIWSAWTQTRFDGRTPDFWNVHFNTGRVDLDTLLNTWSGSVHAGLHARLSYTDLSADPPVTALFEEWIVRVYNTPEYPSYHVMDLSSIQKTATSLPLDLPEYHYGGVGFRGHQDWENPENCVFLTSDGSGRNGHGTRQRWVYIGGNRDGNKAGVVIMGHPSNYRAPQHVRIHPDMPFFNFAPVQAGDMRIEPGTELQNHYRFVAFDGKPDPSLIEQLWNDYINPPKASIKPVGIPE